MIVSGGSSAVQSAYTFWKNKFVTSTGAGGFLRVQRTENGNDTVSEGIGYGMLAAVYMGDQATFDGLLGYAKAHVDARGLMNWHITAGGTTASDGANSALDGDEDIAWALLMASDQWTTTSYYDDASTMIDAMYFNAIAPNNTLNIGDAAGTQPGTHPDYFSPAYYRVFATASRNPGWMAVIDRNYTVLSQVTGTYGLVPDTSNPAGTVSGNYGYDACRTPWRIAMDWCFNAEPRAQTYLQKIGGFFNNIGGGAGNITDGYNPSSGAATSNNHNMAFIGPAGVAGMTGFSTLMNGAFTYGNSNNGGDQNYFPQSLRVVTMLMMSGNFLDYTQHQ
jgi:endo-1,4-beta-D-glucanase Y